MKPHADSTHRRNSTCRNLIGEQLHGPHLQLTSVRRAAGQLGYGRTGKAMPQAVGFVRRQGRRDPEPEPPPRQSRDRHLAAR